jgi:hypothetical protein
MIDVKRGFWLALLWRPSAVTPRTRKRRFQMCRPRWVTSRCSQMRIVDRPNKRSVVQPSGGLSTASAPATGLSSQEKAAR